MVEETHEGGIPIPYSQPQLLLLFFAYCFLGWLWESSYISLRRRTWVNRGFLQGSWLPIYGFGALGILLVTHPFRESIPLTFLLGMAAATLVEGLTGLTTEVLFHVRLWDYRQKPLNWRGYVCPQISLAWGCFALLLVRGIHPLLNSLVLSVPPCLTDVLSLTLTILFAADVTRSVQDALGLKDLLTRRPPDRETIQKQIYNGAFPPGGKPIRCALSLLERNPDAFSPRHPEGLTALQRWKQDKNKDKNKV